MVWCELKLSLRGQAASAVCSVEEIAPSVLLFFLKNLLELQRTAVSKPSGVEAQVTGSFTQSSLVYRWVCRVRRNGSGGVNEWAG